MKKTKLINKVFAALFIVAAMAITTSCSNKGGYSK